MTIVKGQIESLKKIKSRLEQKGVSRFSSLGEINSFMENYEMAIQNISGIVEKEFNLKMDSIKSELKKHQSEFETVNTFETVRLQNEIEELDTRYILIKSRKANLVVKTIDYLERIVLKLSTFRLKRNFVKIIGKRTFTASQNLNRTRNGLNENSLNKQLI